MIAHIVKIDYETNRKDSTMMRLILFLKNFLSFLITKFYIQLINAHKDCKKV